MKRVTTASIFVLGSLLGLTYPLKAERITCPRDKNLVAETRETDLRLQLFLSKDGGRTFFQITKIKPWDPDFRKLSEEIGVRNISWSPDGKMILFEFRDSAPYPENPKTWSNTLGLILLRTRTCYWIAGTRLRSFTTAYNARWIQRQIVAYTLFEITNPRVEGMENTSQREVKITPQLLSKLPSNKHKNAKHLFEAYASFFF